MNVTEAPKKRLPGWLRRSLTASASAAPTHEILERYALNTVCESALCPNRNECYAQHTATFMILGNHCTRSCNFCAVPTGAGEAVEADEPERVAQAARQLGLKYVVITSVARDDLADEGAAHFARTIQAVRDEIPDVQIEVLTPDFHARRDLIEQVVNAGPDVFNHNVETVRRLQRKVRVQGEYERSLQVLARVKEREPSMMTKSGLMLGLGETEDEIFQTAADLRRAGCDILTLGQYLKPGPEALEVEAFLSPETFERFGCELKAFGFRDVFSGPYVRSSYHAGEMLARSLV